VSAHNKSANDHRRATISKGQLLIGGNDLDGWDSWGELFTHDDGKSTPPMSQFGQHDLMMTIVLLVHQKADLINLGSALAAHGWFISL